MNEALEKQAVVTELAREKLDELTNAKRRGKGQKLKEAQDELNKSLEAEVRIRNAINALDAKPTFDDKSAKVTLETLQKIQIGS